MCRAFFSALLQILTDWLRYAGFLFYRDLYLQASAMKLNFIANYLALVIALPEWRYFLCPCCFKDSPFTETQEVCDFWYASSEANLMDLVEEQDEDSTETKWRQELGVVKVTIDNETFWCKKSVAQLLETSEPKLGDDDSASSIFGPDLFLETEKRNASPTSPQSLSTSPPPHSHGCWCTSLFCASSR